MDDATALSQRIARRELSCVELMRETLERIGRANPSLNAIVSLREPEALLAEAAGRDAELARGERRGWMHGFPHAIKDLEETAGIITTWGSPLYASHVPEADSAVVRRIRGAGAIVIGKTNVPEFGYGSQTYNPVFGPTRNPYDASRTAGGSSGGAAAALAAGLVPVADGSDYMGSLRNPAAFCGVYGFRPSLGRVVTPPYESAFEAPLGTAGPMARTPRDLAALLATLAGPDPASPFSIEEDPAALAAPLAPPDPSRLRIGWLGDLGGHLPFEPGILELCEAALGRLGAEVVPVQPGFDPAAAWEAAVTIRHYDAAWLLELPPERLKPELRWEADGARAVTGPALAAAQRTRTQVAQALRALLADLDALALPSAQVFPFDVDTPWPGEVAGTPMPTYHRWMEVVIYASLAGLPAAGVPAGLGPGGLPMGLQLIGRPRGDRALLELVEAYHRATGPRPARVAAMPELVLHALPPSHPCMTAEAALRLKGLAYERIDFTPGEHVAKMDELYGEGNTTVPGLQVDGEPVHGSRRILARLEQLEPEPAALPRADRRRRPRGRALGRRGAPGPRPPAAVGRAALPPGGARQLRRRRAARPGGHRLRDPDGARDLEVPPDHGRAARRRPRRPARQARPRRRARGAGHDRRRGAERRRPPDRRHAPGAAHRRRPAPAARGPRRRADRPALVPGLSGRHPGRGVPGRVGPVALSLPSYGQSCCW